MFQQAAPNVFRIMIPKYPSSSNGFGEFVVRPCYNTVDDTILIDDEADAPEEADVFFTVYGVGRSGTTTAIADTRTRKDAEDLAEKLAEDQTRRTLLVMRAAPMALWVVCNAKAAGLELSVARVTEIVDAIMEGGRHLDDHFYDNPQLWAASARAAVIRFFRQAGAEVDFKGLWSD